MKSDQIRLSSERHERVAGADGNVEAKMQFPVSDDPVHKRADDGLPFDGLGGDMMGGGQATTTSSFGHHKSLARSNKKATALPKHGSASTAVRAVYVEAIRHAVPALAEILTLVLPEAVKRPLSQRTTEELIRQIDAGRFFVEIARLWRVSANELNRWIVTDAERFARAKLARRNQAALWDWVALQVLLHAPSDRVEIMRAEKIAQHCRWRAEAFSRDDYGRNIKVTQVDEPVASALTTRELELIARGDTLPG